MKVSMLQVIAALLSCVNVVNAFYLPGVAPQSFSYGDELKLKVNSLTSVHDLLPMNYYHLPFCQPVGGPTVDHENLGELLSGDKIESSPYVLRMKEDMYCEHLCVADLGNEEIDTTSLKKSFFKAMKKKDKKKMAELREKGKIIKDESNKVAGAIRRGYNNNWIVDNLPAANKAEDDTKIVTRYTRGFPIGYMGQDLRPYVFNHVNIEIMYHPVEMEIGKYRVVRFTVEPFSIKHNIKKGDETEDGIQTYDIMDPIDSCHDDIKTHTSYDGIKSRLPQLAYGEVLFTYDVIWIENLDLKWASRWDVYLSMDDSIPASIHWSNITNSFLLVVLLSSIVASILIKALKRDFNRYNRVATDEEKAEDQEDFGWKLVHADVFRPPRFSPMLFSVAVGTGLQIVCMAFLSIFLSALGFINPSYRGALLMFLILFYAMMGTVSGYTTARLYKTFGGKRWQLATTLAAIGFPGIVFGIFFLLDIVAAAHHSTDAVPFSTMIVVIFLWFGISSPLVYLGSYYGYKKDSIEYPVHVSNIPREIPEQQWYYNNMVVAFLGGVLPFGSAFVEMYFIMSSIWNGQYYYVFGALFSVFLLLLITVSEVSVLLTYFKLTAEDYNWWWSCFISSGSCAFFFFFQAIQYFGTMETNSLSSYALYFGYNFVLCLGIFLMTGSTGFLSSFYFNKFIYGAIKVD